MLVPYWIHLVYLANIWLNIFWQIKIDPPNLPKFLLPKFCIIQNKFYLHHDTTFALLCVSFLYIVRVTIHGTLVMASVQLISSLTVEVLLTLHFACNMSDIDDGTFIFLLITSKGTSVFCKG